MLRRKILGIAGALCVLVIPVFLLHDSAIEHEQSICPFKMLTGFPCPGCGLTKSLVFLYQGDFQKSIHYHLFGPAFAFFCIAAVALLTTEIITKKEFLNKYIYNIRVGYMAAVILGSYHVFRLVVFTMNHSVGEILRESIWR